MAMNEENDLLKYWHEFYEHYQHCNEGSGLTQFNPDNISEVSLLLSIVKHQILDIFASCGIRGDEICRAGKAIWKVERQCLARIIVLYESFKLSKINEPVEPSSKISDKDEVKQQNSQDLSSEEFSEEQNLQLSACSNSGDSLTCKQRQTDFEQKSSQSSKSLYLAKSKRGRSERTALLKQKEPKVSELSKKPKSRNNTKNMGSRKSRRIRTNTNMREEMKNEKAAPESDCKSEWLQNKYSNSRDKKVNARCRGKGTKLTKGYKANDFKADDNDDDNVIPTVNECASHIHGTNQTTGSLDIETVADKGETVSKENKLNVGNSSFSGVSDNESDGNVDTLSVPSFKGKKNNFENKNSPKKFGSMILSERTDGEVDSNVPMICSMCRQHFPKSKDLLLHWKKEHENSQDKLPKRFLCEACGKALHSPAKLKLHYRIHTGARPHPCEICGKSFRVLKALITHIRTHTQEKPYKCQFCPKAFSERKVLTHHERTHTGERSYVCESCGKLFQNLTALNTHKRIHTGEKPYRCDICGESFNQSGTLKSHKRVHTGDKPYFCEFCGLSFSSNSQLVSHRRTHTGERPYKCDHCDFTACTGTRVRQHAVIHSDLKPFMCDFPSCCAAFKRKSHLKNHARTHFKEKAQLMHSECDATNSQTDTVTQDNNFPAVCEGVSQHTHSECVARYSQLSEARQENNIPLLSGGDSHIYTHSEYSARPTYSQTSSGRKDNNSSDQRGGEFRHSHPEWGTPYSQVPTVRQNTNLTELRVPDPVTTQVSKSQIPAVMQNSYVVQVLQNQPQPVDQPQLQYQYHCESKSSVSLTDVDMAEVYTLAYK